MKLNEKTTTKRFKRSERKGEIVNTFRDFKIRYKRKDLIKKKKTI